MQVARIGQRRACWRRIVLSGIDDRMLMALHGGGRRPLVRRSRPAPYVDFALIRPSGGDYLDVLSPNSRYQVRRSNRAYDKLGGLTVRRAGTTAEASEFLAALAELHQVTWIARGKSGAFANPYFIRFHHELIERGFHRGEIELLRITAGDRIVGFLYNYRFHRRVLAYQSGFNYEDTGPHQKPGLTCHHCAIELALKEGMDSYDFLAGEDRYKRSLSNANVMLHWAEIGGATTLRRYARRARGWLGSKVG
jgi:CelD/BcsL family acetyltransferase involved in cellulose biosynthesis